MAAQRSLRNTGASPQARTLGSDKASMLDTPPQGLVLVLEYLTQDQAEACRRDIEGGDSSSCLLAVVLAVQEVLRPQDLQNTRVIVSGHLARSVADREDRSNNPFTIERGSGMVAAKTMPPGADGVVDILVPLYILEPPNDNAELSSWTRTLAHLGAHEAVHATIHHLGTRPFQVHLRESFGQAGLQFVAMAADQVEEHLAEYLSARVSPVATTSEMLKEAFDAWLETLHVQLPAIPEGDPDYFSKGMAVTFSALQILWKTLAYLAADLRQEEGFAPVPGEISRLDGWQQYVRPWWHQYVGLLSQIPMSTEVDIEATDEVVKRMGVHLQRWALEIGFDYHDTSDGGWFQINGWF